MKFICPKIFIHSRHIAGLLLVLSFPVALAEPTKIEVRGSQILGPDQQDMGEPEWMARIHNWKRDTTGQHGAWLSAMRTWRTEQLAKMKYDDAQYRRPELLWTQRSFVQPQTMIEDRYLYDPVAKRYTVDRYLNDLDVRYGGVDSVLLWPIYPNLGIDSRNQWDMLSDLPGGIAGVRQLIKDFHVRGVKVFFPTVPWDNGTRDIGSSHSQATAKLMAEIGADGVNGDTMFGVPLDFRTASDATGHPVAFEPELNFTDDGMLAYNQLTWGYWQQPSLVPLVSKWKWLEPRHMVHVCDRWATDRRHILQDAFFNGVGVESWENIWGWWNQFTARDAEVMRRISTIYRAFPDQLVSADWQPHVPTLHYGVYASEFPVKGKSLWTIINRTDWSVSESIMNVSHTAGQRYFDVWNGKEIWPRIEGAYAELSVPLERHGYGAVLRIDANVKIENLSATLERLTAQAIKPLQSYSSEWSALAQKMEPISLTSLAKNAPDGMVKIPRATFNFQVRGIEIEGENKPGLDVQYPWEPSARREHKHRLEIKAFYMDKYPVTNAQYKKFVSATGYRPKDEHNFLQHWLNGSPRVGDENRPVIWVSLEDARAYLNWAGKRLPNEWEWQYAAQGTDGRLYPWGNEWDATAVPVPAKGRDLPAPELVGQHTKGASPFGVEDMVGHVWQWTNEFADTHTRSAILRGGSYYQPQDSYWYFPQAYKLNEHGKYLLMAPGKDRSGALGFRGVKDTSPD